MRSRGWTCAGQPHRLERSKARQEALRAKTQAHKGGIALKMVQESYSRGVPRSASASSVSAATDPETQIEWTFSAIADLKR